jgi:hypothetical protein
MIASNRRIDVPVERRGGGEAGDLLFRTPLKPVVLARVVLPALQIDRRHLGGVHNVHRSGFFQPGRHPFGAEERADLRKRPLPPKVMTSPGGILSRDLSYLT